MVRRRAPPTLDPITRRRGTGRRPKPVFISGAFGGRGGRRRTTSPVAVTRPIRPRPIGLPPRPIPRPRPRPTRVTVAQPSGREGRLITVSSRSILARGRKKKKVRGRERGKKKRRRQLPPQPAIAIPRRRRVEASPFVPFQEISFGEGRRREGRRGEFEEEERPRRRRAPPRRRRQVESDFDVLNVFA